MIDRKILIAPSILSADFAMLGEEVRVLDESGADYLHIDVMDGHFVPNLTIGADIVKALRPHSTKFFDVHLMIAPVDEFIKGFVDAGADIITVHAEVGPHMHKTLQTIKKLGKKAGIALNPATPAYTIRHLIDLADLVLVMTVNPGFGGQAYIPLEGKISEIRRMIDESGRDIDLEVDGGINKETAKKVIAAGANILVAGSAVFRDGPEGYISNIASLRGNT